MISLYFHIPFCKKKCPYCHFYVIPNRARDHDLLEEGLALEWESQKNLLQNKTVTSVYFGGGTPTLFGAEAIGRIISRCTGLSEDCEITVESNPEEGDIELYSALKSVGVNRISLGVQSLDDRSLNVLERGHTAQKAKNAIKSAYNAGLENISIDLMYDLPDQSVSSWNYTLDQIPDLPITHLSLYNLTIEPHTSFFRRKNTLDLPKQEDSIRMHQMALDSFHAHGFERYEISAFAKNGFTSRHNLGYWTFRPFLGFGPSAFSYWEGERFQNSANLQRYHRSLKVHESPVSFREKLPYPANLKEQIAVQLRLKEGCQIPVEIPTETDLAIQQLQKGGFLIQKGRQIQLTERGRLFYDSVASEII